MQAFLIEVDDLYREQTRALVRLHLEGMHEISPPCHVFALDKSGLAGADMTVWTAWEDGVAVSMGAMRQHDARLGEVKSMRTHPAHLGRGAGSAILEQIISEARGRGLARLSLETGSGPAFKPALSLYHKRGFVSGPAFADHTASDFNQFLHLDLT